LRRGLRPVVVLIDGATFGGYFSAENLAASLETLGLPVCRGNTGDALSNVLSAASAALKRN
jgi:hypothetical protein